VVDEELSIRRLMYRGSMKFSASRNLGILLDIAGNKSKTLPHPNLSISVIHPHLRLGPPPFLSTPSSPRAINIFPPQSPTDSNRVPSQTTKAITIEWVRSYQGTKVRMYRNGWKQSTKREKEIPRLRATSRFLFWWGR